MARERSAARLARQPALCSLRHHDLSRVDRLVLPLVGRDLERLRHRFDARDSTCVIVGFSRTRPEATSRTVCSRCACVLMSGKDVAQAALAQQVDVQLRAGRRTRTRR